MGTISQTASFAGLIPKEENMKSIGLALLGTLVGCAVAGSPTMHVQTDSAAVASFAAYRTFAFAPGGTPPAPFQVSGRSFEVERRMRLLVAAALVRKGYAEQPASVHPDFVVTLASGSIGEPTFMGEAPLFQTTETDAIVIDAFDTSSAAQVWHGSGEAEVDPGKINERLLEAGVRSVLASFPAHRESRSGATSKQAL